MFYSYPSSMLFCYKQLSWPEPCALALGFIHGTLSGSRDQTWAKSSIRWRNKSSSFSSTGSFPSPSNLRYWADLSKRGQCINSTVRSSIRCKNTGDLTKTWLKNALRTLEGRNFNLYYQRENKNIKIKYKTLSFQYLCSVIQKIIIENYLLSDKENLRQSISEIKTGILKLTSSWPKQKSFNVFWRVFSKTRIIFAS